MRIWSLILVLSLLQVCPVRAGEDENPLASILARSYERDALQNILGRSASLKDPPPRPRAPVVRPRLGQAAEERWGELIERYSAVHNLDSDLVRAIVQVESAGNPRAVSPKGATGLMQIMPGTGLEMGARNLFDPEENIASGTRYLRTLLDRFKSVELALWAYNAGPGAVERGHMPSETQDYVPKVLRLRRQYKQAGGS